eukprot:8378330-Pyramimonas_sp.AAC.1
MLCYVMLEHSGGIGRGHVCGKRRPAHRGLHFLGTHDVLCHAIAQWRDRPRASISKRQHIGVPTFWGPMHCYAMLCRSGGIGLGQ